MTALHLLWLPVLLSAIAVFFASSLIHMFLGWHQGDYGKVPKEDQVMDALRSFDIPPGDYFMPRPATHAEGRSPEFAARIKKGPVVVFTVMPNETMSIGRNLILWFIYLLAVSAFSGYI